MAVGNVVFAFLTALVAVNFIFAEDNLLPGDVAYDQAGENYEREERSPKEDNNEELQERTFFALMNLYSSCNYTQGASYCASCTQAIRCFPSNVGMVRNCRGFTRYCNGGRCSLYPGAQCSSG